MNENIYKKYENILSLSQYSKIEEKVLKEIPIDELRTKVLDYNINRHIKNIFRNINISFQLVSPFINNNLKIRYTLKEAENEIMKLCQLFNNIKVFPNPDLMEKIIKECSNVKDNLKIIVDHNLNIIKNDNLDSIYDDELLISFINVYLMINDISFETYDTSEENISDLKDDMNELFLYYNSLPKKMLTKDQTRDLAIKMMNGSSEARKILIERNLRFAAKCSKKYFNKGLDELDIIQEANIGLMVGIDKYDVNKGYSITTYTYHWIRHYLNMALINYARTIRLPKNAISKLTKYKKVYEKFHMDFEREPNTCELAKELDTTESEVIKIQKYYNDTISLNAPVFDESEEYDLTNFYINTDIPSVEKQAIRNIIESDIINMMDKMNLKPIEKDTILMRYGFIDDDVYTLNNVGEKYRVTRENIRQKEEKILNKFRESEYREKLVEYMNNPKTAREEAKKLLKMYNTKKREKGEKNRLLIMKKRNNM